MFGCVVCIAELGKCPQKSDIFTKNVINGESRKSKTIQTKLAIGVMRQSNELTKPPKLTSIMIGLLIILAKIAYKLMLLK